MRPAATPPSSGPAPPAAAPRRRVPQRQPPPPQAAQQEQQRTSLVPDTLEGMESDAELQATLAALAAKGQAALTREEKRARQRSLDNLGVPSFTRMCQVRTGLACEDAHGS